MRLRRALDINRSYPTAHFFLGAALARLDRMEEAREAVTAGLAIDSGFSISRLRAGAMSNNPTYLEQRAPIYDAMRKAGVPEG